MASEDALLLRSMRGFSREKGNPLEEPALRSQAASEIEQVEGGESLDELRSRYDKLRSDELRPEYRGFKVPAGMDESQSEDWFASIDAREDERERKEAEPFLTRTPEPWEGQFLEQMKGLNIEASKEEQRFLRDPAGRAEVYKEFAGDVYEDVMAGDAETIRNVADVTSLTDPTGVSDVVSATQSGRLAISDPERRMSHLADTAISGTAGGIQVLAAGFGAAPLVGSLLSGARLKAAMRGADAADDVSDAARAARVIDDSGFSLAADKSKSVFRVDSTNADGQVRDVFVVTMPDGSSKAFQRSTGTSGTGTAKGDWIPFEGYSTWDRVPEGASLADTPVASLAAKTYWNKTGYQGTTKPPPGSVHDQAGKWIDKYIESKGGNDAVFGEARLVNVATGPVREAGRNPTLTAADKKVLGKINRFLYDLGAIDRSSAVLRVKDGTRRKQFGLDDAPPAGTSTAPDAPAPVFESVLERVVLEKAPNKIGVDDVEKFLAGKGAKKSEIAETKIPDLIDGAKAAGKKSISKDELIQHLDDNKVQIEEVRLIDNVPMPQDILDLGVKKLKASRAMKPEVESLSGVLAPGENLGTQRHQFGQNPSYFHGLYVDYIGDIGDIDRYENVPSDMSDVVNRLIDLERNLSVSDWKVEDAARITEARNAVNAKLADPEYQEFVRSRKNQMQRRRTEAEDDLIQADLLRAQNLKRVGRILDRMPEAESRLAALRKFENLPKYQEYSSLHRQHETKLRAAAPEIERQRTKYARYTVPGGEDYQEILLTVPRKKLPQDDDPLVQKLLDAGPRAKGVLTAEEIQTLDRRYKVNKDSFGRLRESRGAETHLWNVFKLKSRQGFSGSHFDEIPNVMVHIRTKDRVDSKGRKILFVEEIQSDWHQKGLKHGYTSKPVEVTNIDGKVVGRFATEEKAIEFGNDLEGGFSYRRSINTVPDAPLKDTKEWTALAIKRIFREAAEQGYDGVAFSRSDMITPLVTLPRDEAVGMLGNPETFLDRLAELKKRGGQYEEGAEQAEKVFGGNQYYYDKIIPSIAKKETKAKQGTTLIDVGDISLEVPFFELTDKVKDKVIKPQKLYSVALPGIAVGAAAAEEEELSAAAALGAIGMGGMALYRGARRTKVPEGSDLVKVAKKSIDEIDEVIPEITKVSESNRAEAKKYARFRGEFMSFAARLSDRKFSDKELEVLRDPFTSDAVRELSKTNPNIFQDLLNELNRAAVDNERVADFLDRANASNDYTKGGDAAGDIVGSLNELRDELKKYNPENFDESRKALDEATKAFNDAKSELSVAEDALEQLRRTAPKYVSRSDPKHNEYAAAFTEWNSTNRPRIKSLKKEIERITGDRYSEYLRSGGSSADLDRLKRNLDDAQKKFETLDKGPLENDTVRFLLGSLKNEVRGINSPNLSQETRQKVRRIVENIEAPPPAADVATAGAKTADEAEEAARLWREMGTESPYFKKKFGNTKVLDDDGEALPVFHATSGDFDQFRPGSPDSAFGSAIYTSSRSDDVNANYATAEGPDIKNKVDQEIDRIDSLDDFDDDDILDAAQRYMDRTESTDTELLEAIKTGDVEKLKDELEPDLIEQLARQQVLGDEAFSVLKTYVNIENPVYLDPSGTKGRTTFDLEIEYDDDGDFVDESGSVLELLQTIDDVADNFETSPANARNLKQFISEKASDYGEVDAFDIFREVKDGDYYFESDTGGYANSEFIRQVFEQMGFDGIIADAYHFFGPRDGSRGFQKLGMAGITPGTYHYMAFKPEQIKSATGNVGTFDPSGNILKGIGIGAAVPAAAAVRSQRDPEEGNPEEELPPMTLSSREYVPMDTVMIYDDTVEETKAELDRRSKIKQEQDGLVYKMMMLEADYFELDDDDPRKDQINSQYELVVDKFKEVHSDLGTDEFSRFLKGVDYFYETQPGGLLDYDVDRAFEVMSFNGVDMLTDINLRKTQESMQQKRFERMTERGGTLVNLSGQNMSINKLLFKKANTFNHPVQSVQVTESDKMILQRDLNNLEDLKEDGLISYLLYRELKGDVMLF